MSFDLSEPILIFNAFVENSLSMKLSFYGGGVKYSMCCLYGDVLHNQNCYSFYIIFK